MALSSLQKFTNRLIQFGDNAAMVMLQAGANYQQYWDSDISAIVDSLGDNDIVPGTDFTKTEVVLAITLADQLQKFFAGEAVQVNTYRSTVNDLMYKNPTIPTE